MNDFAERRAAHLPASLTRQLIAYIGNKRRLLPFLAPVFAEAAGTVADSRAGRVTVPPTGQVTFLDPMCGSGAVARLARHLGFTVTANDWEDFAVAVTAPYLENSEADLERAFRQQGGVQAVVRSLNEYGRSGGARGYVATHFAPESTSGPRLGYERLFYTAENARFIDRVRDRIDEEFPAGVSADGDRARNVLIALLLYEASTHANTSGVFKAYHRGFGGHGRDALSRILADMALEQPAIIDGPVGRTSHDDAVAFVSRHTADICYLDPPYNSHQYGSNYFMLNTIVRWDKPPVDTAHDPDGNLVSKAGIRADWRDTRSPFCYRKTAPAALSGLIDAIDAGIIMVSYSGSGVITPEELADLLSPHGDLGLRGVDYTAYRGGRQSITRASVGREMVFVLNRRPDPASRSRGSSAGEIARQLKEWEVRGLLGSRFVPARLREEFRAAPAGILLAGDVLVVTADFYRLGADVDLSGLDLDQLDVAAAGLNRARCIDHAEEFRVLLSFIRGQDNAGADRAYQTRALTCLRKFAHRKYRQEFADAVRELKEELDRRPGELPGVAAGLGKIVEQARLRFGL